jgi:hypothetical protein
LFEQSEKDDGYLRMAEFLLCKTFGWRYNDVQETPSNVLDDFMTILEAQREAQNSKYTQLPD